MGPSTTCIQHPTRPPIHLDQPEDHAMLCQLPCAGHAGSACHTVTHKPCKLETSRERRCGPQKRRDCGYFKQELSFECNGLGSLTVAVPGPVVPISLVPLLVCLGLRRLLHRRSPVSGVLFLPLGQRKCGHPQSTEHRARSEGSLLPPLVLSGWSTTLQLATRVLSKLRRQPSVPTQKKNF